MHTLVDIISARRVVIGHSVEVEMVLSSLMWYAYNVHIRTMTASLFYLVQERTKCLHQLIGTLYYDRHKIQWLKY